MDARTESCSGTSSSPLIERVASGAAGEVVPTLDFTPVLPAIHRARQLASMLLPTFLFYLGMFVFFISQSLFITTRTCAAMFNVTACDSSMGGLSEAERRDVSTHAAAVMQAVALAASFVGLGCTGFWATSSDLIGRRPVLILPIACSAINVVGIGAVASFDAPLSCLIPLAAIGAVGGGFGTYNAAMSAHICDTFTEGSSARGRAFALYQCAVFLGTMLGPMLGGLLVSAKGSSAYAAWLTHGGAAFLGSFVCYLLALLHLLVVGPAESVPEAASVATLLTAPRCHDRFRAVFSSWALLAERPEKGGSPFIGWALLFLLFILVMVGAESLITLYPPLVFHFDSDAVGMLGSANGIGRIVACLALYPLVTGARRCPCSPSCTPATRPCCHLTIPLTPTDPR